MRRAPARRRRKVDADEDAPVEDPVYGADVDQENDDDKDEIEPAPLRSRDYRLGHRQVQPTREVVSASPSPWERPRENFTAVMTERVPEMRATRQASFVNGL